MISRITTFAFEGVEARPVDVQVQLSAGAPAFIIVGLPDKAVAESRERVRAAFSALGLALPPDRVLVNLAPADLPKEGSHYDLAIALAILAAIGAIPRDALGAAAAIGELALDGGLAETAGALPAAMAAQALDLALVCPLSAGPEAAWGGGGPLLRRQVSLPSSTISRARFRLCRRSGGLWRKRVNRPICAMSRVRKAPNMRSRSRLLAAITSS